MLTQHIFTMLIYNENFLIYFFFVLISTKAHDIQVDRPRGVSLTKKILYDRGRDFTCLDGSKTINFQYVNDDYCDCQDGSDEPGTSACPNGVFHCTNTGYRPKNIPSSRVNDGLCDCCDGSDEWKNQSLCPNTCIELWEIAKVELSKQIEEASQGYVKRKSFSESGIAKKAERQEALTQEQEKLKQVQEAETLLQQAKEEAEAKETQAKEERRKVMEEDKAQRAKEENLKRGARAFAEMDTDRDASLTSNELQAHYEVDPDVSDGDFTEVEAQDLLSGGSVDLKQFMESVWAKINQTFLTSISPPIEEQEKPKEEKEKMTNTKKAVFRKEDVEEPTLDEDREDYDETDGENYEEEEYDDEIETPVTDEIERYFDDATRSLIEMANEARRKYQENHNEKEKIEKEIGELNKALSINFGPDEAFQALQFQCYELITMEYKYKLCPFDKISQSPKKGGSETNLGRWGSWSGPSGFEFSRMKYDNGLACWNGPARSTEVRIRCGVEHKLLSVDEPSRCAYVVEFATPCACAQPTDDFDFNSKDEL